jgi:transglutaminase-like putative cysteine protease
MTPLTRYGRHLRIEVLLAVVAYSVALREFELGLMLGAAVIASGYITDGPRGRHLPRRLASILALGIAVWLLATFLRRPDPEATMSVIARLACLLATLRLYELRAARDDRQVIALSVVGVVASILYSFQLLFGLVLLTFSLQTIHVLMLNRLRSGLDEARRRRREIVAEAVVPPIEPVTGRTPIVQFRLLVFTCATLAFAGALGVFVIFPRQGDRITQAIGARTGFSTEVDLQRVDRIQQSNREVMTVRWVDPRGEVVRWPQPLLLRGAVLDHWDPARRRWSDRHSSRARRTIATPGGLTDWIDLGEAVDVPATYTQIVEPRGLSSSRLFSRWIPVGVASESPRQLIFDPARIELEQTDILDGLSRPYSMRVVPTPSDAVVAAVTQQAEQPIRNIEFPVPEVRAEAERILRARAPDLLKPVDTADAEAIWLRRREIARIFTEYLQGPDFQYTLDLRRVVLREDVDPIVAFLTEYRRGHCEYFASAMCALCQSLGVEARVVTGYVAIEYDENLQYYVVRESNAHAWVEVRTGPFTWREFDPTATDVLETMQAGRRSWADDWRWLYDRIEVFWTTRFVAFDGRDQSALAERLGNAAGDRSKAILGALSDTANRVNRYFQLGPAGYIWLAVVALAIGLAVATLISILRRRRRLRTAIGSVSSARLSELGFYLDLLEAFEIAGVPKPAHRAPLVHVEEVAVRRPDVADRSRPLVRLFYDVRFGGRRLDSGERRAAVEEARAIRELARALPA